MTLQKKQVYLNRVLSKHYKKLRYTLFNKTKNIPALKTTAILGESAQSIGISVLTINTLSHKDFPGIVDVTFLNGLRKTKKAVVIYQGKTTVPTIFTRSVSKLVQRHPKTQKPEKASKLQLLANPRILTPIDPLGTLGVIDKMLGAGICMHNYTLCLNSQLTLQNLIFLKHEQRTKLKYLDHLAASLISPRRIPEVRGKILPFWEKNQRPLKKKDLKLSKIELSSVVAQVLHKIHFLKGQESLGKSAFNIKKLSNVLGALVEINSKIYFISDKELKQCGLAGGLKHSASNSLAVHNNVPSLLKNLVYSKVAKDRGIFLKTKFIEPNITFFTFLNITTRTYVIYNIKRMLSKLINILSLLILPTEEGAS